MVLCKSISWSESSLSSKIEVKGGYFGFWNGINPISNAEGAIITGLESVDVVDTDVKVLEGAVKSVEKCVLGLEELERIGILLENDVDVLGVESEVFCLTVGCGVAVVLSFTGVDIGVDVGVDSID